MNLTPYLRLVIMRERRCASFYAISIATLSKAKIQAIQLHLQRQHVLEPDRFRSANDAQPESPAEPIRIGLPRNALTD